MPNIPPGILCLSHKLPLHILSSPKIGPKQIHRDFDSPIFFHFGTSTIHIYWSLILNDLDFLPVQNDISYYHLREFVVINVLRWNVLSLERFENQLKKNAHLVSLSWFQSLNRGLPVALQLRHYLIERIGPEVQAKGEIYWITTLSVTSFFTKCHVRDMSHNRLMKFIMVDPI